MTVPEFLREVFQGQSPAGWWFIALSAWLGGAVGSFLNVVVYRLPRGMSLVHPGSRCPACGHEVRWHDNVPVLGWLWLGGRCRDCRAAISARYPLVEAFVALMFGGFAWLEVAGGGINLPLPTPLADDSAATLACLRYAGHMLLACMLLAAAMIERDGQFVPRRLWAPAMCIGIAATSWRPMLRPVALSDSLDAWLRASLSAPWAIGLAEGLCGLAMGVLLGRIGFQPILGVRGNRRPVAAMLGVIGVFLGCQAVCWIALASLLCYAALAMRNRRGAARANGSPGPLAAVFVTTLVFLGGWRWLESVQSRSHCRLEYGLILSAGGVLVGRALLESFAPRPSAGGKEDGHER